MHEMSLCESILQILLDSAEKQNFQAVKTVTLELGALSCVEPEAMRLAFAATCSNTLAHGANLEIITVPANGYCSACDNNVVIEHRYDACPKCGNHPLQLSQGDEMRVKELEVE